MAGPSVLTIVYGNITDRTAVGIQPQRRRTLWGTEENRVTLMRHCFVWRMGPKILTLFLMVRGAMIPTFLAVEPRTVRAIYARLRQTTRRTNTHSKMWPQSQGCLASPGTVRIAVPVHWSRVRGVASATRMPPRKRSDRCLA